MGQRLWVAEASKSFHDSSHGVLAVMRRHLALSYLRRLTRAHFVFYEQVIENAEVARTTLSIVAINSCFVSRLNPRATGNLLIRKTTPPCDHLMSEVPLQSVGFRQEAKHELVATIEGVVRAPSAFSITCFGFRGWEVVAVKTYRGTSLIRNCNLPTVGLWRPFSDERGTPVSP